MEIQARAKINWTLDVVGVRQDGYHLLDSLMQPLALADDLTLLPSRELTLVIHGAPGLSPGEDNLILRAAREMQKETGVKAGAAITLQKKIPLGAGLGGGSADAAAALRGLNALWGTQLNLDQLCAIGEKIGADVPFCLHDAPRRAQGIGEKLFPIACGRLFPLILVQPCAALSTKEVFSAYHRFPDSPSANTQGAMEALAAGDLAALAAHAGNALEAASISLCPEIRDAKEALKASGAVLAQMTGSGSVVFGAYESRQAAQAAYPLLREKFAVCILTETAM